MHAVHRKKLVEKLIGANAASNSVVLIQGGKFKNRYSSDNEPIFRQEPYFQYLFGVKEPDFFGMIDIHNNKSYLFIPRLPESYAWWMGKILPPSHFKELYEVDEARYVDELEKVLAEELKVSLIYTLKGKDADSGNWSKEAKFPGIEKFTINNTLLFPHIVECRVFKTEEELKLLRYVNKITSEAHTMVMKKTRPNMGEHQAEAIFRYETYYQGGCRNMAYTCICASGENGSVLHYGHAAAPNSKELKDGEMVVFDMGTEYHCYVSDITRSFPVNGKFTADQKIIYETVLAAQETVMKTMKPGVSWPDMHRLANRVICEELKKHGLLKGEVDDMMKNHIGALFMPHGLGHFMGIETHDCGGYPEGIEKIQEPGLRSLRSGRILQPNMVITVEPGIYFIEAILEPAFKDSSKNQFLNVERIKEFMNFGGVRIEDDVIITQLGIENMTSVPRSVAEIEKVMAEGRKEFP